MGIDGTLVGGLEGTLLGGLSRGEAVGEFEGSGRWKKWDLGRWAWHLKLESLLR